MYDFKKKYGDWALITGASSGIGKEFAKELAKEKLNLVLVARREKRLKKLALDLEKKHKIKTKVIVQDLSKNNFLEKVKAQTKSIEVGILINNAGFAITGEFCELSLEDQLDLLRLNCTAPIKLSHHFGQKFKKNKKGAIINVASMVGFIPTPFWAMYSSSKSFVFSFSQALDFELKPYGIDVLALCPPATQTEFSKVSKTNLQGLKVDFVVKNALGALGNKTYIVPGLKYRFGLFLFRFFSRHQLVKLGSKITGYK